MLHVLNTICSRVLQAMEYRDTGLQVSNVFLSPFLNSAVCIRILLFSYNVVLNLCTLALQTLDCHVLSGNNNHNKFILFQRQRRQDILTVK